MSAVYFVIYYYCAFFAVNVLCDDVGVCRRPVKSISFCFESSHLPENIVTLFVKWSAGGRWTPGRDVDITMRN